jgi:hypothetical protein
VVVPDVPLAVNLAYKCWSMERRRYRSAHDTRDNRYGTVLSGVCVSVIICMCAFVCVCVWGGGGVGG